MAQTDAARSTDSVEVEPADSPGTVTVRLYAAARSAAGRDELELPSGSLAVVVADLLSGLPATFGPVFNHCSVLLDGLVVNVDDEGERQCRDGSTLDVLPPFAGG